MLIASPYPSISVPAVDLWDFLFDRADRAYPEDHVIFEDTPAQSHTFRQIRDSARQFGRGLQTNLQWEKGDVMAVFTPNSAELGIITFGTLWAGGIVTPFNAQSLPGELAPQLKSADAKGLATHLSCLKVAREAALEAGIPLDRLFLIGEKDPAGLVRHYTELQSTEMASPRVSLNPAEDIAFLVYSSGTTGAPKGVMLSHRNVVANVLQTFAADDHVADWKNDRVVGFLPMFHIYGLVALLLHPIYTGATVHLMQKFNLENFCRKVQENRITIAYVVPPVALNLARHPLVNKYDLSSLQMMHSSAAPLTMEVVKMIRERFNVPIKQGYGLSEASPAVTSQSWSHWDKPIGSVGRLLPSMAIKFMNGDAEVASNCEGELWLSGPNIFKGYYKNPIATAEAIDPSGWYRTGDVGYIDEDNNIYITGRVKELIKYNGFQIAPAQIEAILLQHDAVIDVAVIGIYAEEKATELPRAYIVPSEGHKPKKEEINRWVQERTAPYKWLRGGIRFIEEIPRSPAGKVLRRALVDRAKEERKFELKSKI